MWRQVISDEEAEFRLLHLMTAGTHKFAIEVGYPLDDEQQLAFERLMLKDWIRLIDVSSVVASHGRLMRVFRVMPEAVEWYKAREVDH